VRESPASKDVNTEGEEATALEAFIRKPAKAQQTEKISARYSELWSMYISETVIITYSNEL
jgi:hypothetical protein